MFNKLIPNASAYYYNQAKQQSDFAEQLGFKPDLCSTIDETKGGVHRVNILNILGYIPVISTISGSYRASIGFAYLIKSGARYVFDAENRALHRESIKIAGANLGRGLLEIVPVVGNIFTANIDVSRMLYRWETESKRPYGDRSTISIFQGVDAFGAIPIIGTITNIARVIFFSGHLVVNLGYALSGDKRAFTGVKFGLNQMGIGIIESIPLLGTLSAFARISQNDGPWDDQ